MTFKKIILEKNNHIEDKSLKQGGMWKRQRMENEREGKERKGKEREGKGREGKGREGKGVEALPLTRKLNVNN